MEDNVLQDILSALDKLFPDGFQETCYPVLSDGAASQYSTQCLQVGTVIIEAGKLAAPSSLVLQPTFTFKLLRSWCHEKRCLCESDLLIDSYMGM